VWRPSGWAAEKAASPVGFMENDRPDGQGSIRTNALALVAGYGEYR